MPGMPISSEGRPSWAEVVVFMLTKFKEGIPANRLYMPVGGVPPPPSSLTEEEAAAINLAMSALFSDCLSGANGNGDEDDD